MRDDNAPGRTRTCGPLLSIQHQAFPDRPLTRVCWLDYILDIAVPARIVSEEPARVASSCEGFLRITQSSRIVTQVSLSTRGSQGVPAYGAVHLMSSQSNPFLIKAPTRQMLYPLSYRGTCLKQPMLACETTCYGQLLETLGVKNKEIATVEAISLR